MSGTSAEFTLTLPISEQAFWTIALLFGLVVLSAFIAWGLPKSKGGALSPIDNICERLGLSHGFGPLVLLAVCVAMALGAAGLFTLVDFMKAALHMPPYHQVNDGAAIRNIGLVLAALLGAPFVIWRSYVAAKQARIQDVQTRIQDEQKHIQFEALFNDKINTAAADLAARKQVTRVVHQGTDNECILTEWQDDLVTRAAAIERLEGLATERPEATRRIARMLSIYVRELSREYRAIFPPDLDDVDELQAWAKGLEPIRADMESAVQSLGRLQRIPNHGLRNGDIDLRRSNLQGFDLKNLEFSYANFSEAHIEGAELHLAQLKGAKFFAAWMLGCDLCEADLERADLSVTLLRGADLSHAKMRDADLSWANVLGADMSWVDFCGANLRKIKMNRETSVRSSNFLGAAISETDASTFEHLQPHFYHVFADGSVQLPEGHNRPEHWVDEELEGYYFEKIWRAWQSTLPAEALE